MEELLKSHQVTSGQYNFQSLNGGKYNIPNDPTIKQRFWKLFVEQTDPSTGLVFRITKQEYMPMCVDFDFKTNQEQTIPDERYTCLVCKLTEIVVRMTCLTNLKVIATRKSCHKVGDVFKNGVHVYIQGVYVSKLKGQEIRNWFTETVEFTEFCEEYEVLDEENSFDPAVMPVGGNGLMLISDRKPGRKRGYHIFFQGETSEFEWVKQRQLTHAEGSALLRQHISEIYNFVFERQFWPEIGDVRIRRETPQEGLHENNKEFNLSEFLSCTAGWVPNYEDYRSIVFYLASINYPKAKVVELCNAAWHPQNPKETGAKYDSLPPLSENPVTKGSMIHFLELHGHDVNYRDIFPPKMKNRIPVYYNQYRSLLEPVPRATAESYFTDMLVYIYGEQMFSWKYYVDEEDKHKNYNRRVVTKISKTMPFSKTDTFELELLPTLKEIEEELGKRTKSETDESKVESYNALRSKIKKKTITLQQALDEYSKTVGEPMPNEKIGTDKLQSRLMRKRKLTEYAEINFMPYVGDTCPLPKTVLNTFDGFVLDHFVPGEVVDIKTTKLYEYLCTVFGHSDRMTPRLSELLDRVAFKLQYPQIRTGKIHLISSMEQGVGKSAFFRFLSMIYSSKYCVFHENIDTYLGQFNWHLHSKLIMFIDDLQACSKTQTRKLYSKVTSNRVLIEKKGETPIQMDEFSELWITGNQNSCSLHVCAEDRRILIYKANASLKGNKTFWVALHKEFNNLNIAKAWYDHLKHRDVTHFNYETGAVDSVSAKLDSIRDCMPKTHTFLNRVFSTDEFITTQGQWGNIQIIEKRDHPPMIRVEEQALYQEYKTFVGRNYSLSAARHINTFKRELEQVGIHCVEKRQKMNGRNKWVIQCTFREFKKAFEKRYRGIKVNHWYIEEHLLQCKKYINEYCGQNHGALPCSQDVVV